MKSMKDYTKRKNKIMRKIAILIFLSISFLIISQENRVYYHTPITLKLPVLKVNNCDFHQVLDTVILKRGFHTKGLFKDKIYSIEIKKDSLINNEGHLIYVAMLDSSILCLPTIKGLFNIKSALFCYSGDNPDCIFSSTKDSLLVHANRPDCKDGNSVVTNCVEPALRDFPLWIFSYLDNKFELVITQFVPNEDEENIFLNYDD